MVLCVVLVAAFVPAQAAITVFTDRASWEAAAGGTPALFEDFNSVGSDVQLNPGVTLGLLTFTSTSPVLSRLDAPPLIPETSVNGTSYLAAQLDNGVESITIDITGQAVISWGADVNPHPFDINSLILVSTNGGDNGAFFLPPGDLSEFRGFIADNPFTQVTFSSAVGFAEHGWDNLGMHLPAVPEPGSGLLLAGLLLGWALRRARS